MSEQEKLVPVGKSAPLLSLVWLYNYSVPWAKEKSIPLEEKHLKVSGLFKDYSYLVS